MQKFNLNLKGRNNYIILTSANKDISMVVTLKKPQMHYNLINVSHLFEPCYYSSSMNQHTSSLSEANSIELHAPTCYSQINNPINKKRVQERRWFWRHVKITHRLKLPYTSAIVPAFWEGRTYTLVPGDYNSFVTGILSWNHGGIDITELILVSIKL